MNKEFDEQNEKKKKKRSRVYLRIFKSRMSCLLTTSLPSISAVSNNLIIYSSGSIPIISKELNLKQTLLGGQSFRYI